ncbi:O-antigen ligase family protein [Rahnella victoriana]|uniref:O-antigen ligase family protein n=1 Tax=Rahnella victoriana TaxID=1510570 RepID=A0ABS0DXP3_9GAMM|nr:O-antigen ligase family protein [Rahnella victoriana]MBF7958669.1 O-antigen ligase family protein [Rahnella victoriana]TBX33481.1 O-antigen ligase domain-containing protein [Rahnella victoriana]UHM92127.1 O-antigen ligase family protein [Rahnella victoriana]
MIRKLMASVRQSSFDEKLAAVFFLFITISISFFMYSGEVTRNFFYIITYISIIYFLYLTFKVEKKVHFYLFSWVVFLLGLSKLLWVMLTTNEHYPLIAYHYQISGKRMMLAAFVLYAIEHNLRKWTLSRTTVRAGVIIMSLMFIFISVIHIVVFVKTGHRIKINSDAPTSGGYIFTIFSLLVMYSIKYYSFKHYRLPCLVVMTLTFAVLAATQTRSAIMLFALFSVLSVLYDFAKSSHTSKMIYGFAIGGLIIAAVVSGHPYYNKALARIDNLQKEVSSYSEGHRNSSVGARFSMWRAGINVFEQHPLGQSADSRNALATTFIQQHEGGNPEALRNLQFHLHNDIIDTLSLQGIFGAIILVIFFAVLLLYPFRLVPKGYEFLLLSVPVIYFSQGDTQFYNRESPYFIILVFGYLLMLRMSTRTSLGKS